MGCHTWFYNKIDNMPKEHMSSIKEKLITDINGYWIMNTSKEDFIKEIKENIDADESFAYLKEMLKDGYFESQVSKYKKYLDILDKTICEAVIATNQTYVEALKKAGKFDGAAQAEAFKKTYETVMKLLTEEAKTYLTTLVGDLEADIQNKIEAQVNLAKPQK